MAKSEKTTLFSHGGSQWELLEMQLPRPHPDLLNQKLWVGGAAGCVLMMLPDDPATGHSVRVPHSEGS